MTSRKHSHYGLALLIAMAQPLASTERSIQSATATTPAVSRFRIDDGAFHTTQRQVVLNHVVSTAGAQVESYRASESPAFAGAAWLPYREAPPFELSPRSGVKVVYLQVRSLGPDGVMRPANGQSTFVPNEHLSAIVSDTILLGLPDLRLGGVSLAVADRATRRVTGSVVVENAGTDIDPATAPVRVMVSIGVAQGARPLRLSEVSPPRAGRCTIADPLGRFECLLATLRAGDLEKLTFVATADTLPIEATLTVAIDAASGGASSGRIPERDESNNASTSTIIVR